jgi:hypothetical protein
MKKWRQEEEAHRGNKARFGSNSLSFLQLNSTGLNLVKGEPENRAGLPKPLRTEIGVFHVLSPSENRGVSVSRNAAESDGLELGNTLQRIGPAVGVLGAANNDLSFVLGIRALRMIDSRGTSVASAIVARKGFWRFSL